VRDDGEWQALREEMGDPVWARAPEYATGAGRVARRDEIDAKLAEWTAARTSREVMDRLQARGIPAGIVAHARHHMEDPHLAERGYLRPIEQKPLGRIVLEGPAFRGSDLAGPIVRPAPMLGEHTREVCRELLELSDPEIDRLIAEGALEEWTPPAAS
jgi:crotonobetainyl-CoA:carnitine CoA-transferase CaiB-like acyl-CoA transferase